MRVVVATLVVPAVVSCGGTTTLTATPVPTASSGVDSATADAPEAAPESPNPSATASVGTRETPAPIGSTATIRDASGGSVWEVKLRRSLLNVDDVVRSENEFNEPPPPGFQYAAAEVEVTYVGDTKGFPAMDLMFAFVSTDGTTHKPSDMSVVGPDDLSNKNELYEGGSVTGWVYIAIPVAGAAQGTWRLSQFLDDSEFFFAAE